MNTPDRVLPLADMSVIPAGSSDERASQLDARQLRRSQSTPAGEHSPSGLRDRHTRFRPSPRGARHATISVRCRIEETSLPCGPASRALPTLRQRRARPFVACDCAVAVREPRYDANDKVVKKPRRAAAAPRSAVASAAELRPFQTRRNGIVLCRARWQVDFIRSRCAGRGSYFEVLAGLKKAPVVTGPYILRTG